jgi:hypothetical protein
MIPKRLLQTDADAQFVRDQLARNGVPTRTRTRSMDAFRIIIWLVLFLAIAAIVFFIIRSGSR